MLQPELRCCDYAKATARHRRHRTSVPLFLVRRLRVDEHNVAHTCGFGSRQDATGSDLDLWMPQTNASSNPHSLDVAPVDLTTFDPAHSPVHHSVTPRAQLLKPAGVRATTANAPPPSYSTVPPGCSLHAFLPLAVDDVVAAVRALPDKQSADDPLHTEKYCGFFCPQCLWTKNSGHFVHTGVEK